MKTENSDQSKIESSSQSLSHQKSKIASVAPTRLMRAFLAQKARLLAALRDEGGLFECRFLANLLERETNGVTLASAQADTIHDRVADLRRTLLRETSATDNTPGILDPLETEQFLRQVGRLSHATRHHTHHLSGLL